MFFLKDAESTITRGGKLNSRVSREAAFACHSKRLPPKGSQRFPGLQDSTSSTLENGT